MNVSKVTHLSLITKLHNITIDILYKIQKKTLFGTRERPKLKIVLFAMAMKWEI